MYEIDYSSNATTQSTEDNAAATENKNLINAQYQQLFKLPQF